MKSTQWGRRFRLPFPIGVHALLTTKLISAPEELGTFGSDQCSSVAHHRTPDFKQKRKPTENQILIASHEIHTVGQALPPAFSHRRYLHC
jgi:hypothetical protein